jgi:hypothetical protein
MSMSMSDSSHEGSPSKRRRPNSNDPNKTPTAQDKLSNLVLAQDSQSEVSSVSSISQRSGQSSPTKGIAALRDEKLVEYANFSGRTGVPPGLNLTVKVIKRMAGAHGIISSQDAVNLLFMLLVTGKSDSLHHAGHFSKYYP